MQRLRGKNVCFKFEISHSGAAVQSSYGGVKVDEEENEAGASRLRSRMWARTPERQVV